MHLPEVFLVEKGRQIDVHEHRARRESAPRRYLNPPVREIDCRRGNAQPSPERIAMEVLDEVLHATPLMSRRYSTPPVLSWKSMYDSRCNAAAEAWTGHGACTSTTTSYIWRLAVS